MQKNRRSVSSREGRSRATLFDDTHIRAAAGFALSVLSVWILLASDVEDLWLFCGSLLFLAQVYVTACIPKPPGQSKMREWLDKARALLAPVPHPQ